MFTNRQKRRRLPWRTLVVAMCLALFPQIAQAQVYMHDGSSYVGTSGVKFYDSGGPSKGPSNYWLHWFGRNQEFTYTFSPETSGQAIQIDFESFTAYTDNNGTHDAHALANTFSLRLNDAELSVYEGTTVRPENLITTLTGTILEPFTIMANGPVTFQFTSYSYTEEGWGATVKAVPASDYKLTKPAISMEVCSDLVILYPTTLGASIRYTINGDTPSATNGTTYEGPFALASYPSTVRAVTVKGNNASEVADKTYTAADATPVPNINDASITRDGNTIVITPPNVLDHLNETYGIIYTSAANGGTPEDPEYLGYQNPNNVGTYLAPDGWNGTMPGFVHFDWNTPNTNFKFRVVAQTCAKQSAVKTYSFGKLQVPDPTLAITDNGTTGSAVISWEEGYVIRYTIDGSTPSTTNGTLVQSGTSVTVNDLTPSQTVKVVAYKLTNDAVDASYDPSAVVSDMYLPNGGASGTYGGIVILNDLEDHSWSYYSDGDQPIHSLKPADVKITYTGYGANTMTSTSTANMPANNAFDADVAENQVAVNVGEPENQFIYLKTLENANADGTGNYPYTMIPNPFQVRPKAEDATGTITYTTYDKVTSAPSDWSGEYLLVYQSSGYAFDGTYDDYNYGNSTSVTISNNSITNPGSAAVLTLVKTGNYYLIKNGNNNIGMSNNSLTEGTGTGNAYQWTLTVNSGYVRMRNRSNNSYYFYYSTRYNQFYVTNSTNNINVNLFKATEHTTTGTIPGWRGFYAWRVKSLSDGLGIRANGTNVGVNGIIYPDQEIEFVTSNAKGNEVEFEALWAQAYVNSSTYVSNSDNYQNAYERNFKVGTTLSTYNYPVTISTLNPDGSGTLSSVSGTNYSCSNDVKLENMTLSMSGYLNGNNHSLHIGRGVANGDNNVAATVYGYNGASGSANAFNLRIESGKYTNAYLFNNSSSTEVSSARTWKMILGNDYDRANSENNAGLTITGVVEVGMRTYCSSSSAKINITALSGTFGSTGNNTEIYLGFENATTASQAKRILEVLGGNFLGGVAGGIEGGEINSETEVLRMRFKGGDIHQYVYGSGQHSTAYGSRSTIITGGNFDAWISGACYGTHSTSTDQDYSGKTLGNTYVYFGGDAVQTNTDGIFGAGYGEDATTTNYYTVLKSYVIAADNATIAGNVYGGGNNGYTIDDAEVYVLGGGKNTLNVAGSVFGGANQARSEATTTVTMKNGTVAGSLYAGANSSGTVAGLGTVNISGGSVTNVFGGGLGASTNMAAGTAVNVSGGIINNNVYGGGELGTVTGNTNVTVSGGTMKDVYGAGKGGTSDATISGQTFVNVTGGTIANVYGGGENGKVVAVADNQSSADMVQVTLTAADVWGDGSGYQMLLDADATAYGTTIPESGALTTSGDASAATYSEFEYKIPVNADGSLTTSNVVLNGSVTIEIPAGTYDWCITNPSPGDRVWIASANGNVGGRQDNYVFETGKSYEFVVTLSGENDAVDVTITDVPEVTTYDFASNVTINGGNVSGDVYGGGAFGTTEGNTVVNMKGGNVHGSVYGGALGNQGSVYVAGNHTVNVMGGRVYSNVYGGSRNANDALNFSPGSFDSATNDETVCVVNISGGQIDQQVYAAGYFGNCFGSVYAFIGKDAIYNAPHHVETAGSESAGEPYEIAKLSITGSVWAGGDWGTFNGTFGQPTISGNSNVYIDGQDYITNTTDKNTVGYMGIDGSVFGSGTSCDAGKKEHTVMLRNYGESSEPYHTATRDFASIQRADYLVLDNVHLNFKGQGMINSLNVTELYSIYEVSESVRITGGSTLILEAPVDQIKEFWSASCTDVYTAAMANGYTPLTPSTLSGTPNKVRVNGGNFIKVYHDKQIEGTTPGYGMINGYAYMMASSVSNEATCAYARPRWCTNAPFNMNDGTYDNRNDGGWVSYVSGDNVFDLAGNKVTSGGVQMEYENHTPGSKLGEQYFRIWRTTGEIHEREGIFDVVATGEDVFKYVDVEIELPAWRGHDYYYMFQTTADGANTTIDYGTELMTFNTALYGDNQWMTYDVQGHAQKLEADADEQTEIKTQPEVNYGLVVMPGTANALSSPQIGGANAPALIINNDADAFLASKQNGKPVNSFTFTDNTVMPTVTFRLTYSDLLNSNKTYEPIWVNLVQCDANGNVKDIVKVKLVVNTSTVVGRNFNAQVYAVMNGNGNTAEESHVKVVLPRFTLNQGGVDSHFTVESITWTPANTIDGDGNLVTVGSNSFNKTNFGLEFSASDNYDGTTGWNELDHVIRDTKVVYDGQPSSVPAEIGTTSARSQFSFDFNLYYNGQEEISVDQPELMGTVVYTMKFTNYGEVTASEPTGASTFTITIEVYRRGKGSRYYLDGVNGKNSNPGTTPDQAMLTLNAIFNRSGFLPGDEIYVVNKVTAEDGLEWNGLAKGGNVLIYRYDGGHQLSSEDAEIIGNPDNTAYTDVLIDVPAGTTMTMRGITLDGHYNGGSNQIQIGEQDGQPVYDQFTPVTAEAPMITVEGTLELNQNTNLQQNYNVNNGGAVYVYEGGTLMMNQDAHIQNNKSEYDGAGVYMNGTMIVSDKVLVWNNMGNGNTQNNVYLASKASVLQIGVDADSEHYQALAYNAEDASQSAKIGLTKSTSNFTAGVAEVVYSNETSWLTEPLTTQAIIVHDGDIYNLETGASANMLYWRDTWVTFVTSQPEGFAINNIDSEEDLAWLISLVNGENNQTANTFENQTFVVKKNLDMGAHTWVPIGERNNVFKGTFEGNGYTIEGLNSSLNRSDLGMFGITEGATIQNVIAQGTFDGVAINYGAIAGTMKGGMLSNVEAAGVLTGDNTYAQNIGGLVGVSETGTVIHSSFAVNTLTAQRGETVVGGLVGTNHGNLINSYSNVTMSETGILGGLVGVNNGNVENCYSVRESDRIPAFAKENHGTIKFCYFNKDDDAELEQLNYEPEGDTLTMPGYYAMIPKTGLYGYMYYDNIVHDIQGGSPYIPTQAMSYANNQIDKWPGLLSVLNQWVDAFSGGDVKYTSWMRPTSKNINDDLPVLTFEKSNSLGTTDGKFLRYGVANETENGLDGLLEYFNGKSSYIFLYDNATEVTNVPATRTRVFINEDAVLLQADGAGDFINANVGVSFDNSYKSANDYWGNNLAYDWHFLSTPLADAPLGITYNDQAQNWWETDDQGQVREVNGGYMPDGTSHVANWDFYCYYEPEYHWINFKRNSSSHHHYDEPHDPISYTNETELVPGKGYMAAIDKDTYLNNSGTLNGNSKDVKVTLTLSGKLPEEGEPTKDWGFNLLGNPYQAYLNMSSFLTTNGLSSYWVYIAEQNKYVAGNVDASENDALPSATLHPHQAFFVRTNTNNKEVSFKYSMATDQPNNYSYFRGDKVNYPLVNLFANDSHGQRDLTVIEFNRPQQGGTTKMRAMDNTDFALSAHLGNTDYSILFTEEGADRIPVHFTTRNDGEFTMTWNTMHGQFTSLFLVDNKTGVRTDMLHNDHYTFNATTDDYASRFYITFRVTDVDDFTVGEGDDFAYFNGSEWVINGSGKLSVVDMTGRVVLTTDTKNRVSTAGLAAGVYLMQLYDGTMVRSQKIVIK